MQANRLDDWLAAESRLAQTPSDKTAPAIDPTRISGLELLQGAPSRDHYNPLGTVHGGWFAALLDSAVGCAVHRTLEAGQSYTTLELKVNYVRALTDRIVRVRAIGKVIHVGRRVATAEARLVGPDDKLYAHATTTCLVIDTQAAA